MKNISIATTVVHPFDGVHRDTSSFPPPFFYLQAELQRLQSLSDAVRSSGSVAPANCWLVESEQCKGKRVYRYVQLRNASTVKTRTLGRPNCAQHLDWKRRCQRRSEFLHGSTFNRAEQSIHEWVGEEVSQ